MDFKAQRDFSLPYIILDSVLLILFVFLLFYKKRRVTAYWALAGGLLYFLVDFIGFYLIAGSRHIFDLSSGQELNAGLTALILFWMSMSYGMMDFAFIWLWLNNDRYKIEFTGYIVVQWATLPMLSTFVNSLIRPENQIMIRTMRTTGEYHGIMALIMIVGYLILIIMNLMKKEGQQKIPLIKLFIIGFMAQFLWEFFLLVFGIRSSDLTFEQKLAVLLQNSLIETNLGMPIIYFIHQAVATRFHEDCSKVSIRENTDSKAKTTD